MHSASVGFHCPGCTSSASTHVVTGATLFRAAPASAPVTAVLVGLNVAVHLAGLVLTGRGSEDLLLRGGLIGDAVVRTADGVQQIGVAHGEWWRIVTSGFLHVGLFHLLMNCLLAWRIGCEFERNLGRVRFGLLYLASLLGGSLGVLVLAPDQLSVGASGAVFGLFGAVVAADLSQGRNPWHSQVGPLLAINLVLTFVIPRISIGGHLGGLIAGFAAGVMLFGLPGSRRGLTSATMAMSFLGLFSAGLFAASIALGH